MHLYQLWVSGLFIITKQIETSLMGGRDTLFYKCINNSSIAGQVLCLYPSFLSVALVNTLGRKAFIFYLTDYSPSSRSETQGRNWGGGCTAHLDPHDLLSLLSYVTPDYFLRTISTYKELTTLTSIIFLKNFP